MPFANRRKIQAYENVHWTTKSFGLDVKNYEFANSLKNTLVGSVIISEEVKGDDSPCHPRNGPNVAECTHPLVPQVVNNPSGTTSLTGMSMHNSPLLVGKLSEYARGEVFV
jgi:hypothetical protein